jgi:hypothetical protein
MQPIEIDMEKEEIPDATPYVDLKKDEPETLMRTIKEIVVTYHIIHFTKGNSKLVWRSSNMRYIHDNYS